MPPGSAAGCSAATWTGRSAGTEQPVPLADPVPVYITYLTAMPDGGSIAYFDDVYGRDAAKMADAPAGGGTPVVSAARSITAASSRHS